MFQANVIFPAFSAPYVAQLLFPIAGIATILTEVWWFRKKYESLEFLPTLLFVAVANVISGAAGFLLSSMLPSGLVPKVIHSGDRPFTTVTQGPNFLPLMIIGFLVALVLSILIEYPIWKWLTRKSLLPNLFANVSLAHVFSYAALILIAAICTFID